MTSTRTRIAASVCLVAACTWPSARAADRTALSVCVAAKVKAGGYTSSDGGKSAVRLVFQECKQAADSWVDSCRASGGSEGDCTLKAAMLGQAALTAIGK